MNTPKETTTPSNDAAVDAPANSSPAPAGTASSEATAPRTPAPASPASDTAPKPDPAAAERDQLRDQLLRTAADFDNYRKRARREIEDARLRGKDDAIKEVLPVFDNLERAVAAADSAQTIASVVDGVKMVLKLFEDTAERMGLNRIPTVGQRFDPALHEAIQQKETDEQPPGTVLTEVVPGYLVGQRLLRAAMVVVARKPIAPKPAAEGGDVSGSTPQASAADGGATATTPVVPSAGPTDGSGEGKAE